MENKRLEVLAFKEIFDLLFANRSDDIKISFINEIEKTMDNNVKLLGLMRKKYISPESIIDYVKKQQYYLDVKEKFGRHVSINALDLNNVSLIIKLICKYCRTFTIIEYFPRDGVINNKVLLMNPYRRNLRLVCGCKRFSFKPHTEDIKHILMLSEHNMDLSRYIKETEKRMFEWPWIQKISERYETNVKVVISEGDQGSHFDFIKWIIIKIPVSCQCADNREETYYIKIHSEEGTHVSDSESYQLTVVEKTSVDCNLHSALRDGMVFKNPDTLCDHLFSL